jgi:cell division GTPase FtsZ
MTWHSHNAFAPSISYTQTVPSRFRKEILRAATDPEHADAIAMEGMQRVLINIGAENRLSPEEIKSIFSEVGNGHDISAQSFLKML